MLFTLNTHCLPIWAELLIKTPNGACGKTRISSKTTSIPINAPKDRQ